MIEDIKDLAKMTSPYKYYRERRPEYFSDTKMVYKSSLKKEQFQYILDRLSVDMKQDLFENFCKSLIMKFVTPNVIPQTGPTGGGDGKTDLETHPVADEIAEKWYVGGGGCKGTEKWAIAISTKEDWKSKIKHDIANVMGTGRQFTQFLFFTNRLISSKDSKDCEDNLAKDNRIKVRIFSQNWFVDRVFEQGCLEIAVKELNLSSEYCENTQELGPNDKVRQQKLQEIENSISVRQSSTILDTKLVELALEAAILSRNLELAPESTRGRLMRAENLAKRYGTIQQLCQVIYQTGWTEFYWMENPDATFDCYLRLKKMLKEEINVTRIEWIINLYYLLLTASKFNLYKIERDLDAETRYINNIHKNLKSDSKHHSCYLFLHLHWLMMKMMENHAENDLLDDLVNDMTKTLEEANHHIDIPLESYGDILEMIGMFIKENDSFENMIDRLSELLSNRQKDITGAEIQLNRGEQNLSSENFVQAIRHLGQSVLLFGKEQTKREYVIACCMLGMAYEEEDLLYAAKAMMMRAASMLLHQTEIEGTVDRLLITVLNEICKIALRSGQIIDFLNFYHLRYMFSNLNPDFIDDQMMKMIAEHQNAFAVRLLTGDPSYSGYGRLPEILKRFEMAVPLDVLFLKLGYPEKISKEFKALMSDEKDIIKLMRDKIEDGFYLFDNRLSEETTVIETLVNGCKITAQCKSSCLLLPYAEVFLAFIESLCSTMTFKDLAFSTNHIHFDILNIGQGKTEIITGNNTSHYIFKVNYNEINEHELWETMCMFMGLFFTQNAMSKDMMNLFEDKQTKEKLLHRLSCLTTYASDFNNVVGENYKPKLSDWQLGKDEYYAFQGKDDLSTPFENRRGKQADNTITSIIDFSLWNKAKWKGCGFFIDTYMLDRPILFFAYQNIVEGIKIFDGWEKSFMKKELNIRISFLFHVDKSHPAWYRVHVCQDLEPLKNSIKSRHVTQASRMHTMQAFTSENIDNFRLFYERCHGCHIAAVYMNDQNQMVLDDKTKRSNHLIPINNVFFREAWEVGLNDIDSVAVLPDDDPIIPENHLSDAPVLEVLRKQREILNRKN